MAFLRTGRCCSSVTLFSANQTENLGPPNSKYILKNHLLEKLRARVSWAGCPGSVLQRGFGQGGRQGDVSCPGQPFALLPAPHSLGAPAAPALGTILSLVQHQDPPPAFGQ